MALRPPRGKPVDTVSREVAVTLADGDEALAGMEARRKTRVTDPLQARLDDAVRRVDELSMDVEILRRELELQPRRPLLAWISSKRAETSPSTQATGSENVPHADPQRQLVPSGRRTEQCDLRLRAVA